MSNIIPFDFETNAVRIVMRDGAPWFVAADVCRVLGISKHRDAIGKLDDDERSWANPRDLGAATTGRSSSGHGGARRLSIVSESGLFGLILRSNKPSAKRFRKWVTAEVLPAIRRDGSYSIAPEDREALAGKRAHYAALPEKHQERAQRAAAILQLVDEAIEAGSRVSEAVEMAAREMGVSPRTIWNHRRAIYMVPRADWEAALAPKWSGQRTIAVDCHPEAMRAFLGFIASGARVSDGYRRMAELAEENGWAPLPSKRTMYRAAGRLMPVKGRVA